MIRDDLRHPARGACPPNIFELMQVIRSDQARIFNTEQIQQARRLLADCKVDLYTLPSANPGVAGNPGCAPHQTDVMLALEEGHRFVAGGGANRSGKTTAIAVCFCRWLRDHASDGDIYWVVAQSWPYVRSPPQRLLWELLPRSMFAGTVWAPKLGFGASEVIILKLPESRGQVTIHWKNEEMDIDKFESERVNGVWWSEARREDILDAMYARTMDSDGFMLIDYLPCAGWHKFRLRLDDNWYWRGFTVPSNGHNLPAGAPEKFLEGLSAREAEVRYWGKESASFGAVYQEFSTEHNVCRPFSIPDDWPMWMALDYGYANPNATIFCAMSPQQVLYVVREHYARQQTIQVNVDQIKAIADSFGGLKRFEWGGCPVADPSIWARTQARGDRQERLADEFARCGLALIPGKRASTIGEHGMVALVRRWMEAGRLVFFSTCEHSIREHQTWRVKSNPQGDPVGSETFEDASNHTTDCSKMLIAEDPQFFRLRGPVYVDTMPEE